MSDDLEPAEVMRERWNPQLVDAWYGLRVLLKAGLGDSQVTENDVVAFRYPSVEAAETFRRANLERNGCPTIGIAPDPDGGGVIGVVDLRPQLDPALGRMNDARIRRRLRSQAVAARKRLISPS